jgi:hypothetical protein
MDKQRINMAKFFNTPIDLLNWVKTQNSTAGEAADKLRAVIGSSDHAQDIAETTRRIFVENNSDHAAEVLFGILANYNITEEIVKAASAKIGEIYAADELLKSKIITAEQHGKLVKEAQIMRQPGQYQMELRVCPKLPYSVGNRRISTYNCIHYCLDSMTLDEEPNRVYCMEALWRKHVIDKFSRDFKDQKTGQLIGGYINNRFFVFPDSGTPANQDVARNAGHSMELKPGVRTNQPKPYEYSMERRLQEQREKGSTKSITLTASDADFKSALMAQGAAVGFIKLAAVDTVVPAPKGDDIYEIFSAAIELHNEGIDPEVAAVKLAETHSMKVEDVIRIQEIALRKIAKHVSDVYVMTKEAQIVAPSQLQEVEQNQMGQGIQAPHAINLGAGGIIPEGTVLVKKDPSDTNSTVFVRQDTRQEVSLSRQDADAVLSIANDLEHLGMGAEPKAPPMQATPARPMTAPRNAVPASTPTVTEPGENAPANETPVY